jgi:anti-sigma regulatory factor (Ser/Thr protein kinase)
VPYVTCPQCGLTSYSAAHYSTDEHCQRCGAPLRPRPAGGPQLARELAPDVTAPALARRALRTFDDRLATLDLDTVQLLATEVVGNAVRHAALDGGAPIILRVFLDAARMRIEIHDSGPGFEPMVAEPDPRSPSGRGLFLVDKLASDWGVQHDAGTTVWFEIRLGPR